MIFIDKDIPFNTLYPPSNEVKFPNARSFSGFDSESIQELADSIKKQGLINRLSIWKSPSDKLIVVGGHRRYLALSEIKHLHAKLFPNGIPCRILEAANEAEARQVALADNLHRKALSTYELVRELHNLRVNYSGHKTGKPMQLKDLAKMVSKSITWVSRYVNAFDSASEETHKVWQKGEVPDSTILQIVETEPVNHDKQNVLMQNYLGAAKDGGRSSVGEARQVLEKAKEEKKEDKREKGEKEEEKETKETKKEEIKKTPSPSPTPAPSPKMILEEDDEEEEELSPEERKKLVNRTTLFCDKQEREELIKEIALIRGLPADTVTEYAQGYIEALELAFNLCGWGDGSRDQKLLPLLIKARKEKEKAK